MRREIKRRNKETKEQRKKEKKKGRKKKERERKKKERDGGRGNNQERVREKKERRRERNMVFLLHFSAPVRRLSSVCLFPSSVSFFWRNSQLGQSYFAISVRGWTSFNHSR